jgi:hypothetical protein
MLAMLATGNSPLYLLLPVGATCLVDVSQDEEEQEAHNVNGSMEGKLTVPRELVGAVGSLRQKNDGKKLKFLTATIYIVPSL